PDSVRAAPLSREILGNWAPEKRQGDKETRRQGDKGAGKRRSSSEAYQAGRQTERPGSSAIRRRLNSRHRHPQDTDEPKNRKTVEIPTRPSRRLWAVGGVILLVLAAVGVFVYWASGSQDHGPLPKNQAPSVQPRWLLEPPPQTEPD